MTTFFKAALLIAFLFTGVFATTSSAQAFPPLPENQLTVSPKTYKIDFVWQGDSMDSRWEPYSALLLPVRLPSCPEQFYMQFDLGSPYSMFYRSKLEEISAKYPNAIEPGDTATILSNYTFIVGKMPIHAKEIQVKKFGSPRNRTQGEREINIIGTIGADFIDGRVVLIDYPNRKITSGMELSSNVKVPQLSDFVYMNRSVLLPAVIKGKRTVLFFDTGTSAFELLTDKTTAERLSSPGTVPARYPVNSWNNVLTANTAATPDSLEMAFQNLPINRVTYIEGASNAQVEGMMKMGIGGMIGNKLFLHHKLLLDTRNKKFSILKSTKSNQLDNLVK